MKTTIATLIIIALGATHAFAQTSSSGASQYSSPQHYAMEFKVGPFTPDLDAEFNVGPGPYEKLFGDSPGWMMQAEFDFQIWRGFGSIGVGFGAGYFNKGAAPFSDDGSVGTPASGEKRVAGETSITLIPFSMLAVYRFDVLAQRYDFPVVPYIKLGLAYTLWSIYRGDGSIAEYEGEEAQGGSLGWQFNLGLALLLDIFEPQSSKTLDEDLGINHTYLFVELYHLDADAFSGETALDVGDTSILGGLAIEF